MKRETISESDLHAFVDGELANGRLDAMRAHLDKHPADAARVESWRRQNAAIRRAFEPVMRDPAPRRAADKEVPRSSFTDATPRLDLIRAARRRRRAITTLAVEAGHMKSSTASGLVGAAILSTLVYPFVGQALQQRAASGPAQQPHC